MHAEIWLRKFFCLTCVEPKDQSNEHNQAGANDFQHLIWIFWVCLLSPLWYNIDHSQLMSQFDSYQLQLVYPTMEWEISSMKLRKPLLTHSISHSIFSIHCTNVFLYFSCVFTFLEIIKHDMPKMLLFFLPSSILKWLHKNLPILKSFF